MSADIIKFPERRVDTENQAEMSVFTPGDDGDLRDYGGWMVDIGPTDCRQVGIDVGNDGGIVFAHIRMTPRVALQFARDIQAAAYRVSEDNHHDEQA